MFMDSPLLVEPRHPLLHSVPLRTGPRPRTRGLSSRHKNLGGQSMQIHPGRQRTEVENCGVRHESTWLIPREERCIELDHQGPTLRIYNPEISTACHETWAMNPSSERQRVLV